MKMVKVTTDNSISIVDVSKNPGEYIYSRIAHEIGCSVIEIVRPQGLEYPFMMIVDGEGLLVDRPIINPIGSYLYRYQEHRNPIVGHLVIAKEVMTDEGPDIGGLSDQEAASMVLHLQKTVPNAIAIIKATMERHQA